MLGEEESSFAQRSDVQLFYVDHHRQVLDDIAQEQAPPGGDSSDEVSYGVAVRFCHLTDSLYIVFVFEVEDEHVVCLPVDRFLNGVGLVGNEIGKQSNMLHPC